jgi:hypothetical protein
LIIGKALYLASTFEQCGDLSATGELATVLKAKFLASTIADMIIDCPRTQKIKAFKE